MSPLYNNGYAILATSPITINQKPNPKDIVPSPPVEPFNDNTLIKTATADTIAAIKASFWFFNFSKNGTLSANLSENITNNEKTDANNTIIPYNGAPAIKDTDAPPADIPNRDTNKW